MVEISFFFIKFGQRPVLLRLLGIVFVFSIKFGHVKSNTRLIELVF